MKELRLSARGWRRSRRRYVALATALLVASGIGVAAASAGNAGDGPRRSDNSALRPAAVADPGSGPLSRAQERRAAQLARSAPVSAPVSGPASGPVSAAPSTPGRTATPRRTATAERDVRGAAGAEVLDSSRLPLAKGAAASRVQARVELYDYATDSLLTRTVDLSTGRVTGTLRRHGVQPPPTADEARQALAVILADRRLGPGLRTDYTAATGKALTGPSQLVVQAMTYRTHAGTGPAATAARDPLAVCGTHRCVQLFVRVPDGGPWIDTSRLVIDLSARRVAVVRL